MKRTTCTIYDCEFAEYIPGVIIGNNVYALYDDHPVPAREYVCEHVDFGMVQFYLGSYDPYDPDAKSTSKWGYFRLSDGQIVIPPIYEHVSPFYGDRAGVRKNGKYGFLDPYGNLVVRLIWDDSDNYFFGGLCPVKKGFLWGYINEDGTVIVQPRFEFAGQFKVTEKDVYTALIKKDGKYGYLDNNGQYIIEPYFDDAKEFWRKGFAPVNLRGVWGFIDTHGNYVVAFQFEQVESAYFYPYYLVKKDRQWGAMDEHLNVVMPEKGVRYVIYGDKKIYLGDGCITSERRIKGKKAGKKGSGD
jgi:hypothetical protein